MRLLGADELWRAGWFYVGLADSLPEDGDHLTLDLPRLSITLQNFRGQLCGFWNVCSHRATQMRVPGRGNGHLRCPYHGWTYNSRGVPIGIPENEQLFGLTREDKDKLALRAIEIESRGPFLFARATAGGPGLSEHLGALALDLQARDLAASARIAAKEAAVDLPWTEAVKSWGEPVPRELRVPPNLRLLREEGWTLLQTCTAVTPARSSIITEVFHRDGRTLADLPASLAGRWEMSPS